MNKVIHRNLALAVVGAALLVSVASAEDEPVNGSLKLGYVASSGNSESESLSFAAKLGLLRGDLSHRLGLEAFSGSQDGTTSAEKYALFYQLNRQVTESQSVFLRLDYDDDRFSGFDYQVATTVGLSKPWNVPERHTLTTDVGVGMRSSEFTAGGSEDEGIVRLAAAYSLKVSETTSFEQSLSADVGEESTVSKAQSSLSVAISDSLALTIGLHFKHFSDPVAGAENLDRETTVSLGYSF